jgi:hypothetical protein
MPVLYAPRIVELWEKQLSGEKADANFQALTPYSTPLNG